MFGHPGPIGPFNKLKADPNVQHWYRSLLEGTGEHADEYLEGLHHFSVATQTHPNDLLTLADNTRGTLIERFRREEAALGHDARAALGAVESWIHYGKQR
ncbi:MAG: hypothetical protein ACRECT_08160 [Thermoplasmata archaeon]